MNKSSSREKTKKKSRSQSLSASSATGSSNNAATSASNNTASANPLEIDEVLVGKLRQNGYQIHQLLGEGSYSRVYRASSIKNPEQSFACKLYKINKSTIKWMRRCLDREFEISMMVKHRNIVEAFCAYRSEIDGFLVLQYASNSSVRAFIKRQPAECYIEEDRIRSWLSDIFSAVAYLHGKEIAHRDIKTENFLFDDEMRPLLCDFSFAVFSPNETTRYECMVDTICGTTLYLAPEVHACANGQKYNAKLADIYALGVCLFEMVTKQLPFHGKYSLGDMALVGRQQKRDYSFPSKIRFSNEGRQLLEQLLNPFPSSRITINRALHEQWFLRSVTTVTPQKVPRSVRSISSSSSNRNRHRSSASATKSLSNSCRRRPSLSSSGNSPNSSSTGFTTKSSQPNSSISTCLNAKTTSADVVSLVEPKSMAKSVDSRLGQSKQKRTQSASH